MWRNFRPFPSIWLKFAIASSVTYNKIRHNLSNSAVPTFWLSLYKLAPIVPIGMKIFSPKKKFELSLIKIFYFTIDFEYCNISARKYHKTFSSQPIFSTIFSTFIYRFAWLFSFKPFWKENPRNFEKRCLCIWKEVIHTRIYWKLQQQCLYWISKNVKNNKNSSKDY